MVFIKIRTKAGSAPATPSKDKKGKDKQEKKESKRAVGREEVAPSGPYRPHIVDHSVAMFLENLRKCRSAACGREF